VEIFYYISFMILMLCYRSNKLILILSEEVNVMNVNYRTLFVTTMIMSIPIWFQHF